jgi:type III pantothenate kinase
MNLVIDIGNTRVKLALFKGQELIFLLSEEPGSNKIWSEAKSYLDQVSQCLISSVSDLPEVIRKILQQLHIQPLYLSEDTPLPFTNSYHSRTTLGYDRIAAIAGACQLHPGKDVLVIDAGTAITFDLKNSREEYLGGNISPGLSMRFRALHDYTTKLPLLNTGETSSLLGNDTRSAILNGVQKGIIFETNTYIESLRNKYPGLVVLLTGGDSHFFDNKLKKPIFVLSNLTLLGLNFILRYNAEKL